MKIQWKGNVPYDEGLEIQNRVKQQVMEGEEDTLLLLEHPPVYTLGKSADHANFLISDEFLEKINATRFVTERGGDVTFHGPEQLVGYPIVDLNRNKLGARRYVELLEQSVIELIGTYGLQGYQIDGLTGIWVRSSNGDENKIGAIGIKISRGVTMHGFALNVNTDLKYFTYINPCGILDKGVTSIQKELGREVLLKEVAERFGQIFSENIG